MSVSGSIFSWSAALEKLFPRSAIFLLWMKIQTVVWLNWKEITVHEGKKMSMSVQWVQVLALCLNYANIQSTFWLWVWRKLCSDWCSWNKYSIYASILILLNFKDLFIWFVFHLSPHKGTQGWICNINFTMRNTDNVWFTEWVIKDSCEGHLLPSPPHSPLPLGHLLLSVRKVGRGGGSGW